MCTPVLKNNTGGWSLFTRIVSSGSDKQKRVISEMGDIDNVLCTFHGCFKKIDTKTDVQIMKRRLGLSFFILGLGLSSYILGVMVRRFILRFRV